MLNRTVSSKILDLALKFYIVVAVVWMSFFSASLIACFFGFSFIISLLSPEIIWAMTGFVYLGLFHRTYGEDVRTKLWLFTQINGFLLGVSLLFGAVHFFVYWTANVFTGLLTVVGIVVVALGLRGIRIHFRSKCLPQEHASSD